VVYNPNQIKSADLVTYDDEGNVIPLSERFNDKNEDIRYSLKKGAEEDVKKALNQKDYTEDVYLTESSPSIIANQNGVRNLPMLMKASHIRENVFTEEEAREKGLTIDSHTHYHGLGETLFLKIIDGLDDVKLAYRGTKNASNPSRRENYFVLISQHKDAIGNTVNVPVYINEKGQYNRIFVDTNKIATVFGRDDLFDYIQKEVNNGNLVRIKNRSTNVSELKATNASSFNNNASTSSIRQDSEKSQEKLSKKASMTESRIDYLIADSGAGTRTDYAQSWITSINPTDFLNLTVTEETQNRDVFDKIKGDYGTNVNEYDYIEGLKKETRQTPYLAIDVDTGKVVGHEGRHRMRALEKEGITSAEIKIEFRGKDGYLVKQKNGVGNPLEIIDSLKIYNQSGTGQSATIKNIIPLNEPNRENIVKYYGDTDAKIKYSMADDKWDKAIEDYGVIDEKAEVIEEYFE